MRYWHIDNPGALKSPPAWAHHMENLLYWAGMLAVAVNALTGVLDAGRKNMDLIGVMIVGAATALGGGTVRDVLLHRQVFWISDQVYLIVALATTFVIFFAVRGLRLPPRLFLIPDALGLALFTIVGTQIALEWQAPWLVASLLGVITGVVGGVLRDVLCNEVPLVFVRGELYASAAWMGALVLIGLQTLAVSPVMAAWAGMATVLGVRLAAMALRITLPIYSERK
ncbi:MAG: trimeric intracellular cation channel family protein [Thiobacillus sp.]|nr:trimeric intracellular cation channel family protein [Thiobacillus sp.]